MTPRRRSSSAVSASGGSHRFLPAATSRREAPTARGGRDFRPVDPKPLRVGPCPTVSHSLPSATRASNRRRPSRRAVLWYLLTWAAAPAAERRSRCAVLSVRSVRSGDQCERQRARERVEPRYRPVDHAALSKGDCRVNRVRKQTSLNASSQIHKIGSQHNRNGVHGKVGHGAVVH